MHTQITYSTLHNPFEIFFFINNLIGIWKVFIAILANMVCKRDGQNKRI